MQSQNEIFFVIISDFWSNSSFITTMLFIPFHIHSRVRSTTATIKTRLTCRTIQSFPWTWRTLRRSRRKHGQWITWRVSSVESYFWGWKHLQTILTAVLLGSTASSLAGSDSSRKRKNDWMSQNVDLTNHLVESGPVAKIASKDRDRRKSQGKSQTRF